MSGITVIHSVFAQELIGRSDFSPETFIKIDRNFGRDYEHWLTVSVPMLMLQRLHSLISVSLMNVIDLKFARY